MRTALVLLFALAVAAIPGSLIPQRNVSPVRVSDFIAAHPTLGPLYDKVGLFHVYTSPWFSAIYLLLFVSLIGCIIPRVGVYARALRSRPPKTPRNLRRLPAYATAPVRRRRARRAASGPRPSCGGSATGSDVARRLGRRRARLPARGRQPGLPHQPAVRAARGRPSAALYGFRGSSVVIVGQGFSNNLTQYDDFSAGAWFGDPTCEPFTVMVKDFQVKFETGPVQRGAARLFRADVEVTDAPGRHPA